MGLEEEDHRGEVPFSSHQIQGTCCQHDVALMMLTMTLWPRQCLPGVSTRLLLPPPPPPPYSTLWKQVTTRSAHSRGVELLEGAMHTSIIWNSILPFGTILISTSFHFFGDHSISSYRQPGLSPGSTHLLPVPPWATCC